MAVDVQETGSGAECPVDGCETEVVRRVETLSNGVERKRYYFCPDGYGNGSPHHVPAGWSPPA